MKKINKYIVGVDEAGRGPLAGPVAVGVAIVPHDFDWSLIPGVGDSKKVSPENREAIFRRAQALKRSGHCDYHVALISHRTIDRDGITRAVRLGIERCFKKLNPNPHRVHVKLDGLLKAPKIFLLQDTIIKGDAKERIIGLASILAKVTRDRAVVRASRRYPEYGFATHKGYGTKTHRIAIKKHGLSPYHRRTFCRSVVSQ